MVVQIRVDCGFVLNYNTYARTYLCNNALNVILHVILETSDQSLNTFLQFTCKKVISDIMQTTN